jgi:tRNA threonylcarbamoyladenosine biosynthesis protein TsaE
MAPILDENTLEFISRSPDQTQRLGARLGALLRGGEVICLEGSLGAGKTCLAQGIGRGWGVSQTLTSPTFVLVREYARPETTTRLLHVDLYRISGAAEALTLGIEEMLGDAHAICIIEWAERARSIIPEEHLWLALELVDATRRTINMSGQGKHHEALVQEFRQTAFGA